MYLRRAVSRTLALPRRAPPSPAPLGKGASLRRMSSNKLPGTSRSNMLYYLVVGATVSAGGYYTYKTVISEPAKHTEHTADFKGKKKAGLHPFQENRKLEGTPEDKEEYSGATEECDLGAEARSLEETPEAEAVEEATPAEATPVASATGPEVPAEAPGKSWEARSAMGPEVSHAAPDQECPHCPSHGTPGSPEPGHAPPPAAPRPCAHHDVPEGAGVDQEMASAHDQ
ncbi:protein MGARP [Perognathus longimembris pacificus]|uniref:protein MGARP n=1 Tax=Perognathus longimembris pacificus TaxID=214514 RepID=UPI00201A1762|nr:protein MGARP [Perognathus longimembris pacificus]